MKSMEARMYGLKGKKNIAAILAFVLVMASVNLPLPARERRGSTVEVTMTDGSRIKGELLAVKDDALLVYDRDADQGKRLDLQEVVQVKVLKESKFLEGIAIGIAVGLVISINNLKKIDRESLMPLFEGIGCFLPLPITGLCGGLLGALSGIDKKLSLAGESSRSVQQNLEKLKRYAREKDFEKPDAE